MEFDDRIDPTWQTLDDLQNGYYVIQSKDGFRFGIDAVLLADFAKTATGRAVDLCTGSGIIPILLSAKTQLERIDAVEIHPTAAEMAAQSVSLNGLDDRIYVKCADLRTAPEIYGKSVFDAVTVNPPYIRSGGGIASEGDMKLAARHEVMCTLEDVISVSSKLLKPLARFYMVHRPHRLADIIVLMRQYKIEPKLMRFVCPSMDKPANMVLIQGIKNAKSELKLMPDLYVYDRQGNYTKEIDYIYGR